VNSLKPKTPGAHTVLIKNVEAVASRNPVLDRRRLNPAHPILGLRIAAQLRRRIVRRLPLFVTRKVSVKE
jgi:hypothetical protein